MLLEELTCYLDALASRSHTPGGGAAAAVTVAQALALLSMVCNLTIGKKRFEQNEQRVKAILGDVTDMRAQALRQAEEDMEAFDEVMQAYRLPCATQDQQSARRQAIDRSLRNAARPPFRLMELAAQAIPLADQLKTIGNPNLASDVLIGRLLLVCGIDASKANVEVNLKTLPPEDPFVSDLNSKIDEIVASLPRRYSE